MAPIGMARYFDPRFDKEPDDPRDLRSRSDERRERKSAEEHLMAVAEKLVGLSDRALAKLTLPEDVADALHDARLITSDAARNRALRTLRAALRAGDAEAIEKQLAARPAPKPAKVETAAGNAAASWCERLTTGGDAALDAFVEACPEADRQQIRNLARNAARARDAAKPDAVRALRRVLERLLG